MKPYSTNSLSQAAYLVAKKHALKDTSRNNGKVSFQFSASKAIEKAAQEFFQNKSVPVLDYFDALRRLKAIIHQ